MIPCVLVLACLMMGWLIMRSCSNTQLAVERQNTIDITPEQIQSIRDIGQWEFLTVSDEEFIDTARRSFLRTDRLARIYYGTMRLGIDLTKASDGWINVSGDTAFVTLPPVQLLDERFIDEARTVAFYESGSWHARDREDMYQRARRRMLAYGLAPQNIKSAEDNADAQFRLLMQAMGFKVVVVSFENQPHRRNGHVGPNDLMKH